MENTVAQRCSLGCAHHLMAPLRPLSCEQAHPFHTLPNVLLSPHTSGHSEAQLQRRATIIAANLDAVAQGREPRNCVHVG